jgi:hypothetical protein
MHSLDLYSLIDYQIILHHWEINDITSSVHYRSRYSVDTKLSSANAIIKDIILLQFELIFLFKKYFSIVSHNPDY